MIPDPPRRVLIVDRLRNELAVSLRRHRPDLELRARDRGDIGPDDIAWADAYVGFAPPAIGLDGIAWVHAIGAGTLLACLDEAIAREKVEPLALGIAAWHKELGPAGESTVVQEGRAGGHRGGKLAGATE